MRLSARLSLLIALAALGPLVLLSLGTSRVGSRQMLIQVSEMQASTADGLALSVDTWLSDRLELIQQELSLFDVENLDDANRAGFLQLVHRSMPAIHIVSLLSADGVERSPSVIGSEDEAVSAARFTQFRRAINNLEVTPGAVVVGAPYVPAGRNGPVLPVAASTSTGTVLAVELVLDEVAARFANNPAFSTALLDARGEVVLAADMRLIRPEDLATFTAARWAEIRYTMPDGTEVIAASSPIPHGSLAAVVAAPASAMSLPGNQIQLQTTYFAAVAGLLSIVLGMGFARQISGPIVRLRDAALEVAAGQLGGQVPEMGGDELAELGRSFNLMSTSLAQSATEISAKNEEIEAFNRVLQERVEQRTAELKQAQRALVRSEKLAAVGEMGAGLAHELNNPIAGILGMTQLLQARQPDDTMLAAIEREAQRCRDILAHLQRYSDVGDQPIDRKNWHVVELDAVLQGVLTLVGGPFRQRGIAVHLTPLPTMRTRGDRAALGRAVAQVLTSLRTTGSRGAELHISAMSRPGQVGLCFAMSGAVVKKSDDWMASGMGLWSARQVLAAHGGELIEASVVVPDTASWLLWLPAV
ncbi:MAG: two-component system NtrC family sensor kinase [Myxococcota bacterium]|jgi:two-component system NtrC family sensor kinase